jgi:nitrilase
MQNQTLKVAVIQLPSLPIEKAKLDYYLMIAKSKKVDIALLPEYTTNLFFKEMEKAPLSLIEEQSSKQIENLSKLSEIYGVTIVAPFVAFKKKQPYKTVAVFSHGEVKHYFQHLLMPYKHWNERAFFKNELQPFKPFTFIKNGFKVAVIGGFEAHFDKVWEGLSAKGADAVLIPTASTFESVSRWRELFRVRAFTNNVYIVRANRIGEYEEPKSGEKWEFYGDSFIVNPFGEIENNLGSKEEILVCELDKHDIAEARKTWQFGKIANTLGATL